MMSSYVVRQKHDVRKRETIHLCPHKEASEFGHASDYWSLSDLALLEVLRFFYAHTSYENRNLLNNYCSLITFYWPKMRSFHKCFSRGIGHYRLFFQISRMTISPP